MTRINANKFANVCIKIRGIYSTALTKLFRDLGYLIVEPSEKISMRFALQSNLYFAGVQIRDRMDEQGVLIQGDPKQVDEVIGIMREKLLDVVVRKATPDRPRMRKGGFPLEAFLGSESFDVEFPSTSKSVLDKLRSEVVVTIKDHHKLKTIEPDLVDKAEEEGKDEMGRELIYGELLPGKLTRIEHVRPEGEFIELSPAEILEFDPEERSLKLRREFGPGRYDGLKAIKEEGDYAITEATEGSWVVKHSYYSEKGELKGNFYNINTPVEFYPDRIRYVDLHVDVVKFPDGRVKMVDQRKLEEAARAGYISQRLKEKAMEVAQKLTGKI